MLAYRLISGDSLFIARSFCPCCRSSIAPYDLVPLLSWIALKGRCRQCNSPISLLYPFIEVLTAFSFSFLIILIPAHYYIGYGIFLSALIITIRTDLETMLISRYTTLFLIPIAFGLSAFGYLPISSYQSLSGTVVGYGILWVINRLFYAIKKQDGIGEGDFELLSMIGSFTGIEGVWISLLISSFTASLLGIVLIMFKKLNKNTPIPFGPFIALGAMCYIFLKHLYPTTFNFI